MKVAGPCMAPAVTVNEHELAAGSERTIVVMRAWLLTASSQVMV